MSIMYMDKRGFVNQSNEHAAYILRQYKNVQSIQIVVDENSSMNIMSFPISRLYILWNLLAFKLHTFPEQHATPMFIVYAQSFKICLIVVAKIEALSNRIGCAISFLRARSFLFHICVLISCTHKHYNGDFSISIVFPHT